MTDERLTELVNAAAGTDLNDRFSEIDGMTDEQLDAYAASNVYDWWRTAWPTEHKRAVLKHAVYLGWSLVMILPEVLADDTVTNDLGNASAEELVSMYQAASAADVYGQINSLPEAVLDILAQDFRIVWWNPNADVETKRAVFKSLYEVYRHIGTPAAVDTAAGNLADGASIKEWFEYEGKPYHFRISVDLGERFPGADTFSDEFTRGLNFYKNVRSALDSIEYVTTQNAPIFAGVATAITESMEYLVPDSLGDAVLVDENENILTDENGGVLTL